MGSSQGWKGLRDAVENRGPALLFLLDPVPLAQRRVGVGDRCLGVRSKDVGVPVPEFVMDTAGDVSQVEASIVGSDPGMKHHLEEQVAQFLLEKV